MNQDQLSPESDGARRVLDLVRGLQEGSVKPEGLSKTERLACTEYFFGEGMRPIEIAKLLDVDDRSVRRYRAEIAEKNMLERDPELAKLIAGRMFTKVDYADSALRRVIRDERASPSDKIDACRVLVESEAKLIQALQGMGYLPSAAQRIDATVELVPPKLEELKAQIAELASLDDKCQRLSLDAPVASDESGEWGEES